MDPSAPINPHDLIQLLQSGGNVAAMIAIYLGAKLLGVVRQFLTSIKETLDATVTTNKEVMRTLNELRADIQQLHTALSINSNIRGPRIVPNTRGKALDEIRDQIAQVDTP